MSELEAGRELDELVAQQVMGVLCVHDYDFIPREEIIATNRAQFLADYRQEAPPQWEGELDVWSDYQPQWCIKCHARKSGGRTGKQSLPRYSTDIAVAWTVLDEMLRRGYEATLHRRKNDDGISFFRLDDTDDPGFVAYYCADAMPVAICHAALKALAATPLVLGHRQDHT